MGNKKEQNAKSLRERLCHSLDISPDIFPGGTFLELRGRCSVTLRGCGRLLHYGREELRFASREGQICVRGQRLCCSSYRKGIAVVDGHIDSISFE